MPKGNSKEKRLARERQGATGKPYTVCLAEIRAEYAEPPDRCCGCVGEQCCNCGEGRCPDDLDDPPVQCWHTEPTTTCDWNICRQPERLAAGDYGTDPALDRRPSTDG